MFNNKKGQASTGDRALNSIIGVVILVSVIAGTVGLVLDSFTNLSGAGLALGVLFATVLPLLLAVGIFQAVRKGLRF
ncbi:MAG: hypothetical protein GWO07_07125 [Candidatus Dadabacteria bacterium]|nr:hypothetical protein [Candidatus Dadabacteria bacterium]NIV12564.1 hypothetical protein [Fodinibius sp.]